MIQRLQLTIVFCFILYITTAQAVVYIQRPADFQARVEVSACFLEKDGKFLFLHSQDHKSQGNTWGIPGGKVEKNESALDAVMREVEEETEIMLNAESIKHIQTVYITNKSTNFSYVYHMYSAPYSGSLAISIAPSEHKGFTWVSLTDALKMELMDDEAPCIELAYPEIKQVFRVKTDISS